MQNCENYCDKTDWHKIIKPKIKDIINSIRTSYSWFLEHLENIKVDQKIANGCHFWLGGSSIVHFVVQSQYWFQSTHSADLSLLGVKYICQLVAQWCSLKNGSLYEVL